MAYRDQLHKQFEEAFEEEASLRKDRPDWLKSEREFLLNLVNEVRKENKLAPVKLGDIIRLENRALGSDYFHKISLYCSELAQGLK